MVHAIDAMDQMKEINHSAHTAFGRGRPVNDHSDRSGRCSCAETVAERWANALVVAQEKN